VAGVADVPMTKALQVDPDIGLREILEISQDNRYSVQYSPFLQGPGGALGGTIIRQASPLKGETMLEGESFSDYTGRLTDMGYGNIANGLENARNMALQQEGTTGVALIEQEGQTKILSQGAANLAVEGQKGARIIEDNLESYDEALDALAGTGGSAYRPQIA